MLMCRDLARIASDYIDGELTTKEKLSVRIHLMMCRHCRSFIGNLRASIALMRGHSSMLVEESYINRLDEEIARALAMAGTPSNDGDG